MIFLRNTRASTGKMNNQGLKVAPSKTNVLGVGVSRTDYKDCTEFVIQCAQLRQSCTVAASNVHAITSAYLDPDGYGNHLNQFTVVAPDGQPIRWALNLLRKSHQPALGDRVRGPELMLCLCEQAAAKGISIFLYGSTDAVLEKLQIKLKEKFPNLSIAGAVSPPFRPLTPEEDAAYVKQIRESGAGLVFIGLGCPRQEIWAFEHTHQLDCVLLCVGAAFDFHSGNIAEAPQWMQRAGLEWLFRLCQEPSRLWKRYLLLNPLYLILFALQVLNLLPLEKPETQQEYLVQPGDKQSPMKNGLRN